MCCKAARPENPVKPKIPSFCVISSPSSSISSSFFHCSPAARWRTGRLWILTLDGWLKGIPPTPQILHLLPSTRERDSLFAFTYYLAQLITGHITCVGGQYVSAPGLCQWLGMGGRKKKPQKPQRDRNLLCLTQFKKRELAKPQ